MHALLDQTNQRHCVLQKESLEKISSSLPTLTAVVAADKKVSSAP